MEPMQAQSNESEEMEMEHIEEGEENFDVEELAEHNNAYLDALVQLLIEKGLISEEELHQKLAKLEEQEEDESDEDDEEDSE